MNPDQPFSYQVDVRSLPTGGMTVDLKADFETLCRLAKMLGVSNLKDLHAHATIKRVMPTQMERYRVHGHFQATVEQPCVVTLEPVVQEIREYFSVDFERESVTEPAVEFSVDQYDPPDPMLGDMIDVGALVVEHLTLGIDRYPRIAGAEVEPDVGPPDDLDEGPFAILKSLENKKNRCDGAP